jgi:hypothetical protein
MSINRPHDVCPFTKESCYVADLCDSADNLNRGYSVVKECSTTWAAHMVRANLLRRGLIPKDWADVSVFGQVCPLIGVWCDHANCADMCDVLLSLLYLGCVKEGRSCSRGRVGVREYLLRMKLIME